jgi:hypothetical protein
MEGKDYYNHVPYLAFHDLNLCLSPSDRPQVRVFLQDHYAGKIVETTVLNCCCITEKFQELDIFDNNDQLIYRVTSKNPQRGHFGIFPCWGFDKIKY